MLLDSFFNYYFIGGDHFPLSDFCLHFNKIIVCHQSAIKQYLPPFSKILSAKFPCSQNWGYYSPPRQKLHVLEQCQNKHPLYLLITNNTKVPNVPLIQPWSLYCLIMKESLNTKIPRHLGQCEAPFAPLTIQPSISSRIPLHTINK